jgi:hypothetical protein
VENHEWNTPGQSSESELPAKVPRRWVGQATGPAPEPEPDQGRDYRPDRSWDKLLLVVGAAVIVAALLIVPGILNQGGQNPVAEAAQATMDSSGVRMTFSATVTGPLQMTMQGNGVLNGETQRAAIGVDAEVSGSQASNFRLQEIIDDHDVYVRAPDAGSALGLSNGWVRFSADDFGGSSDGLLGSTSSTSPKELLDTLGSSSDNVSIVGQELIGKRTATHYTANIDLDKLLDEIRDQSGDEAADVIARLNPTETVDVWIDHQGLLRRTTANVNFGSLMNANVTIDFSDYGIQPQIDLPPDSQVQDLSGLDS